MPRLLAKAVKVTQSRVTRNSKGDSRQPCLTPVLMLNGSVFCPLCTTCAEKPSYSFSDGGYLDRYSIAPQQQPQHLSADTIEGLFEVYKVDVQGGPPLDTLLHNNSQCRYLVLTAPTSSKPRLLFSQFFVQCHFNAFQNHSAEHLTCHVQQHNVTPVFTVAQIAFLWQLDYQTLLPFIPHLLCVLYLVA